MYLDNEYLPEEKEDLNYLMLESDDGTCLFIEPNGTIEEARELDEPIVLEIGDIHSLVDGKDEDYFGNVSVSLTIAEARSIVKTLVNLIHDIGGDKE